MASETDQRQESTSNGQTIEAGVKECPAGPLSHAIERVGSREQEEDVRIGQEDVVVHQEEDAAAEEEARIPKAPAPTPAQESEAATPEEPHETAAAEVPGDNNIDASGTGTARLELQIPDNAHTTVSSSSSGAGQRAQASTQETGQHREEDEPGESSSQVTSPSISSPPYWMHTQSFGLIGGNSASHGRNISNVSVESVLPPGAITLQDNEREDDGPGAGSVDGRDRNRACWARSVEVTDYVTVNGSTTNIGAFVVWNIRVRTLSGSNINIRKRYSEFDEFRRQLVQTFPNFEAAVPELPPKSMISKFRPNFLEKRRNGLQYFLNCILLNPEFSGSPVLKEFLFS